MPPITVVRAPLFNNEYLKALRSSLSRLSREIVQVSRELASISSDELRVVTLRCNSRINVSFCECEMQERKVEYNEYTGAMLRFTSFRQYNVYHVSSRRRSSLLNYSTQS